ncbi:MAG: T9SS type A sorting domain-containing protein [Bacteroidota bacterium]
MKKIFLLCFLTAVGFTAKAQITITDSDMPSPGNVFYQSIPDTLLGLDLSQTGTSFVWDYSSMTAIAQTRDTFISISDVPFAIRFQLPLSANLVQYLPTPDSVGPFSLGGEGYQVYRKGSVNYEDLGVGGELNSLPLVFANDPTDKVYFFPLTYGDMDSSVSVAEIAVPNLFYIRQERKRINTVDGWGDLISPYGTFSTIRIKSEITGRDTISFDTLAVGFNIPTTTEYKWLGNGHGVPLLQINTNRIDSLGGMEVTTSIRYQDSLRVFGPNSILAPKAKRLTMYPNPANEQVRLDWAGQLRPGATLKVVDMQGRVILENELNGYSVQLMLHSFSSGTYLVQIKDGERLYSGKLQISK